MFSKDLKQEKISFSWGYPDLQTFPLHEFKKVVNSITYSDVEQNFQYHPGQGIPELREEIAKRRMGDFANTSSDEVIITPGATFGIFLLALYFKKYLKCKKIGVFLPCYDTALEIFKIVGIEVVPIPSDIIDKSIKHLYLMPRFSNPDGQTFNRKKRELIRSYINNGAFIIEDDVYHIFNYDKSSFSSFKSKFPEKVFYIDSFSKILAPGLRLGYIVSPDNSVFDLVFLQKYICSSASTINQQIVHKILRGAGYQKVVSKVRKHYCEKMDLVKHTLKSENLDKYYVKPSGGYYIWLKTPKKYTGEIKKQLYLEGVNLVNGDIYYTSKRSNSYVRLSIANIEKKEIVKSIKLIKKYLYE